MGTIWRDLSKPPQRRQGPYIRSLLLLVGTPLVLGPAFASRRAEHRLLLWISLCLWYTVFITLHVCVIIFMASPLYFAVGPRSLSGGLHVFTYFKMCVLLISQLLRLVERFGSRKPVLLHQFDGYRYSSPIHSTSQEMSSLLARSNVWDYRYSNWLSLVGPQSLCNRSFWWRFCVVVSIFGFFCGCRGFCHRTESDLFLFFFSLV